MTLENDDSRSLDRYLFSSKKVSDVQSYEKAFASAELVQVAHLCGRILRGKRPEDFCTLTDDPDRKTVMLMGSDGLSLLLGKNGYSMLLAIGYMPEYIAHKMSQLTQFKLIIFPESEVARLATWDNTLDLVGISYPSISQTLKYHGNQLKTYEFSEIEEKAGYTFSEIEKVGKEHPNFMTYERFVSSPMSLVDTRAFLYFTAQLRELYSGDGYTYTSDKKRHMQEYITLNKNVAQLGEYALIDINVELPYRQDVE